MAKVSLATASLILRGKYHFSPKTCKRVLDAAKELKYRPNLLVQGIQSGKTYTIGVIMPMTTQFRSEVLTGIHEELVAADHIPFVVWSDANAKKPYRFTELEQIHRLVDRRVDGVILYPEEDQAPDDYLNEVWKRGIPLVSVDREMIATHADFVGADDKAGAKMIAEHFLDLNHKHFGYIFGMPKSATTFRYRFESFEATIKKRKNTSLVDACVDVSKGLDIDPVVNILNAQPRPTAIFAANDYLAATVMKAASSIGLSVPDDVSVVGFGDLDICSWVTPMLTTVQQFPRLIGREAARLVLRRSMGDIEGAAPQKVRISPKLIIRKSTAKTPKV